MNELFKSIITGFKAKFKVGMEKTDTALMDRIATVYSSTTGYENYGWLVKLQGMKEWLGERIFAKAAKRAMRVRNRKWSTAISMDIDDFEDNKAGPYGQAFEAIGVEAANLWPDLSNQALLLNSGWVDGKKFFAADRVYGKATICNAVTTAFSYAAVVTALATVKAYKGENGSSLKVRPDLLVVGPALENDARLLATADKLIIGGVEQQNTLKGAFDVMVNPEFTDTFANVWMLMDTKKVVKPVGVQKRQEAALVFYTDDTCECVKIRDQYDAAAKARGSSFLTLPHLIYRGGIAVASGDAGDFIDVATEG
jgi:phage major head subunit gpT-like protein